MSVLSLPLFSLPNQGRPSPIKPMMHIPYSPYFTKIYKSPYFRSCWFFGFPPTFTMMHLHLHILLNSYWTPLFPINCIFQETIYVCVCLCVCVCVYVSVHVKHPRSSLLLTMPYKLSSIHYIITLHERQHKPFTTDGLSSYRRKVKMLRTIFLS